MSRNRGVATNGDRLRQLRTTRGLTREHVAQRLDQVAPRRRCWSAKTVEAAERGGPVDLASVRALAIVYRTVPKALLAANETPDLVPNPPEQLDRAEQLDRQGRCYEALHLCEDVQPRFARDSTDFVRSRVRLATFQDHTRQPDAALQTLNELFDGGRWEQTESEDFWWALYQRGVIGLNDARRICSDHGWRFVREAQARVKLACNDLGRVQFEGPRKDHRIAARHHALTLHYLDGFGGRLSRRESLTGVKRFEALVEERSSLIDERAKLGIAYEYRCLMEINARLRRRKPALLALGAGLEIADEHKCPRYRNKLVRHAQNLGILD